MGELQRDTLLVPGVMTTSANGIAFAEIRRRASLCCTCYKNDTSTA
eukprot:COSAG03_NODE_3601_length_1926_cov_2.278599_1_plen_45_part_10